MSKSKSVLKSSQRVISPDSLLKFGYTPNGGIEFDSASSVLNISYSGSSKLRVDTFGTSLPDGEGLVIGHTAQLSIDALVPEFQVIGTADKVDAAIAIVGTGTGIEPTLIFAQSRGTVAVPTASQNGEVIGELLWVGHDGTDFANTNLASIHVIADGGAVINSNSPGALIFSTTPAGAGTVTEALRIDSSRHSSFKPGSTNDVIIGNLSDSATYGALAFHGDISSTGVTGLFGGDAGDEFLYYNVPAGAQHQIRVNGTGELIVDGTTVRIPTNSLFIGDTINANMTVGLTINQGANDNEILAFKSSDVLHGLTSIAETDTFFGIRKATAATGGIEMRILGDDSATLAKVWSTSVYGGQANTAKTTAAEGLIHFIVAEHDGAGTLANVTADGNLFAIQARVGGTSLTRFLIDEDGDMYSATAGQTFDHYDDQAILDTYDMVRSGNLKGSIKAEFGKVMSMNEQTLIDMGVLGAPISEGGLTNQTQLSRVLVGNARQMNQKHMSLVERVDSLTIELEATTKQIAALTALESN